jgi:hypothetical protein
MKDVFRSFKITIFFRGTTESRICAIGLNAGCQFKNYCGYGIMYKLVTVYYMKKMHACNLGLIGATWKIPVIPNPCTISNGKS